ncbi:GDYXXLXY domain-containing protein [Sphingobacterium endophyticum]|uniref:GDYXXLXY domain-containing protein n=1 Tax=Sphingobacterium endophyticum TaxID=2546448 RepID=UPI0012E32C1B|nr:GDYXXLXY domain-containing protein [Sphingobacterium endophyticum]
MKKLSLIIITVNLIGLLIYFNYSISQKEQILKVGELVLLKLAPVDPRSLMQGDYMQLSYEISQNLILDSIPKRGYVVLRMDKNAVGHRIRYQPTRLPLNSGELLIEFTRPDNWNLNIGSESYFFEEGTGDRYEKAVYGGLKIDEKGNSLLVGLYDKDRKLIN